MVLATEEDKLQAPVPKLREKEKKEKKLLVELATLKSMKPDKRERRRRSSSSKRLEVHANALLLLFADLFTVDCTRVSIYCNCRNFRTRKNFVL